MERDYPLEMLRNFGIIAHIDAGKTTTSERILFYTGMTHMIGEVHEGGTVTDWMEQERERGIKFTVEVKRSLRVLDGAVVVFDGVAGVEPQSETNWRYADEAQVPRICFINKLDRTGASFERSYKSILERLNKAAVRMQIPIGLEDEFEGVIDLLKMKFFKFEGDMGSNVIESDIPEKYQAEAKQYHNELVERIVENDEKLMN